MRKGIFHARNDQSAIVNDSPAPDNSAAEYGKSESDCTKGKTKSRNCESVRRNGCSAKLDYESAISRCRVSHAPYIQIP
ncbi:MAG TPA: hypothetical protein VH277_05525 [Gemmatimonadaceae bacterium]|nr:hypothetical protein [Gemmatimonadaceae bacterium]